jgi:hypothetical protein
MIMGGAAGAMAAAVPETPVPETRPRNPETVPETETRVYSLENGSRRAIRDDLLFCQRVVGRRAARNCPFS